MLYVVRRTKTATPLDVLAPGVAIRRGDRGPGSTTAVHYATFVTTAGNVTAWTRDCEKALTVTAEVAQRVRTFYAGKANVGQVEAIPASQPPPVEVSPVKVEAIAAVPAKVEPVKVEPVASEPKAEPFSITPAEERTVLGVRGLPFSGLEPMKVEPKVEAKVEPVKVEPVKIEPAKIEPKVEAKTGPKEKRDQDTSGRKGK